MKKILLGCAVGLLLVVGALGGYMLINLRLVQVPTGSMANTIIPGDHLLVTKDVEEIKRGDIVVFKFPQDPKVSYISRTIGLPGDEVLLKGNKVFINGQAIPEQRVTVEIDSPSLSLVPELNVEPAPAGATYRVYYLPREPGETLVQESMLKYAVNEPIRVPAESYFMLGDCRDNSLDSRYWGFVPRANIWAKPIAIADSRAMPGQPDETEMRRKRAFTQVK
jgi:signal peptidase I